MTLLEKIQRHYTQRDLAAREWKNQGGKVVGYFCDSVPVEMIQAAGFLPVRLSGDPFGPTDTARKYFIPRFTTREGFVDSMLNSLLTGVYDFLDYLIIPHTRDSIHRLYQLLGLIRKNEPERHLPELFFLDTLHTPFFSSAGYERDRFIQLKETLEGWSGIQITFSSLSEAIETSNENKRLLQKAAVLRAAADPHISGVEALQIIGSSLMMDKNIHNDLLRSFLEEIEKRLLPQGPRVFVSASPLDHLQLYRFIESNKALVVGEDHCWGNRCSEGLIDNARNPLEAIADRYHFKPPCPRMFPMSRRIAHFLRCVEESNAGQVFFFVYEHDQAQAWEITEKKKALEEKGIRSLVLINQPYRITEPGKLQDQILNFLAVNS
jgi:benzoyl-CoA reductase/2-hydroxyglutaryl-CoA dehydratase subunit BcrC/BadD/HgdB